MITNVSPLTTLEEQLRIDEGVRNKPYQCSAGAWTIGVGWNITENGIPGQIGHDLFSNGQISEASIDMLLAKSIEQAKNDAYTFCYGRQLNSDVRWEAIVNMAFNLGLSRLSQFKKMQQAIRDGDWDRAADEAKDSKWYTQVGRRAERIVEEIRTGHKEDL